MPGVKDVSDITFLSQHIMMHGFRTRSHGIKILSTGKINGGTAIFLKKFPRVFYALSAIPSNNGKRKNSVRIPCCLEIDMLSPHIKSAMLHLSTLLLLSAQSFDLL
jgi:hypothetical protein